MDYIPFALDKLPAKLNLTFTGTATTIALLLNQSQYDTFVNCNCVFTGNYTASTWQSPQSSSYETTIDLSETGAWFIAFLMPTGTGNERTISETSSLIV